MKMKKACEATALTERAIRLYLKRNLLSPRQTDGMIDFSPEDIQQLKDIALLRELDFTIEQISCMIHDAAVIPDMIRLRANCARTDMEHEDEVHTLLSGLDCNSFSSLHLFAAQIRKQRQLPPEPHFGKFDEINDELRANEQRVAFQDRFRMEKRKQIRKQMIQGGCVIAVFAVFAIAFLSYPRIRGFLSIAPLSIAELNPQTAAITIHNEWAADVIGSDTFTVPYRIYVESIAAGDRIQAGCQLAIELTNWDLIQIGVNPLQTFQTKSAALNTEWMKLILRSLFHHDPSENAILWIHEPCNLTPLFGWNP